MVYLAKINYCSNNQLIVLIYPSQILSLYNGLNVLVVYHFSICTTIVSYVNIG